MKPVNQRSRSVWRRILGGLGAALRARLGRPVPPSSSRAARRAPHRPSAPPRLSTSPFPADPASPAVPSVAGEMRRGALIGTLACGLPVALAARASLAVSSGAVVWALLVGSLVGALIGLLLWLSSDELYAEPVVPASLSGLGLPRFADGDTRTRRTGDAHPARCALACAPYTPISARGAVRRRRFRRPRWPAAGG